MNTPISKSRTKKTRLRDKEDLKKKPRQTRPYQYHTVLFAVLFLLVGLALIHLSGRSKLALLQPGQKAPSTIIVSTPFRCVDLAKTAILREQATDRIAPVFKVSDAPSREFRLTIDKLLKWLPISSSDVSDPLMQKQRIEIAAGLFDLLNITIDPATFIEAMTPLAALNLRQNVDLATSLLKKAAIVSPTDKQSAFGGIVKNDVISLQFFDETVHSNVTFSSLLTPDEALFFVTAKMEGIQPDEPSGILIESVREIIKPWIRPNLEYNPVATTQLKKEAAANVKPVHTTITSGSTLVEQGEIITPNTVEVIRSYERRLGELETPTENLMRAISDALLLLAGLVITGTLFLIVRPSIINHDKNLLLLLLLSLLTLLPLRGFIHLYNYGNLFIHVILIYMIPVGLSALLAAILLDGASALALGFWISFNSSMMLHRSFTVFAMGMLVTVFASRFTCNIHRRSSVFRVGLVLGLLQCTFVFANYMAYALSYETLMIQLAAAMLNGIFCSLLTILLLPLFEWSFGITTDITLLELSDMGNPLLQRLAIEAPGTYHHSIMVANLSAAAAQEIGANALKVRVCAYFHDIGKLTKPQFFIENTQWQANPHDDIAPSMSTLVIMSHVKEGLTMANIHRLPRVVKDAIQQHHGTSLISYFYHKASQQLKSTADDKSNAVKLEESDFRYSGPLPCSPEMAILSLADSIEAASRSLEKPTVSKITHLIDEIVTKKLLDGQLDNSGLTINQLSDIKKSFAFSITNMLHGRIAYPKDERGNKQSSKSA
ncbi:MAG: HDIG domain-containing protein [Spartobacteria bacterium]|nr:HDIG domain-containing protein [Spartobacteria bacterium]